MHKSISSPVPPEGLLPTQTPLWFRDMGSSATFLKVYVNTLCTILNVPPHMTTLGIHFLLGSYLWGPQLSFLRSSLSLPPASLAYRTLIFGCKDESHHFLALPNDLSSLFLPPLSELVASPPPLNKLGHLTSPFCPYPCYYTVKTSVLLSRQ